MFKLLHNLLVISPECLLMPSSVTTIRVNHNFKFLSLPNNHQCLQVLIFPRTVPEWNNLPSHIVNEQTLNSFKQSLY